MPPRTAALTTPWYVFDGQNIKGTPQMPAPHAAHDFGLVQHSSDVAVIQEFKWGAYWEAIKPLLKGEDSIYPGAAQGIAHPIQGGQPIVWDGSKFLVKERREHLLMQGKAKISDDRWIRAVLPMSRKQPTLGFWAGTTHFVVGGDGPHDGPERKAMMAHDLKMLDDFLAGLVASGYPVIFELDANIHPKGATYQQFRRIVAKNGGIFHGTLGVEYLFTINGRYGKVEVEKAWTIPTSQMYTDHEGRLVKFRIVATGRTPKDIAAGAPGGKSLASTQHKNLT